MKIYAYIYALKNIAIIFGYTLDFQLKLYPFLIKQSFQLKLTDLYL
jgi:hypothetical protein